MIPIAIGIVLRIKFCGGRKFSASKSPTSCSCKPLQASVKRQTTDMIAININKRKNLAL